MAVNERGVVEERVGLLLGTSESTQMQSVPAPCYEPHLLSSLLSTYALCISQANIYLWCCLGSGSTKTTSKYRCRSRLNRNTEPGPSSFGQRSLFLLWSIIVFLSHRATLLQSAQPSGASLMSTVTVCKQVASHRQVHGTLRQSAILGSAPQEGSAKGYRKGCKHWPEKADSPWSPAPSSSSFLGEKVCVCAAHVCVETRG